MGDELTGERKLIDALLATEARLGVQFSAAYRDFVANRKRYVVMVKRIAVYPVGRCDWLDESKTAIAIGRSHINGDGTLCFKVSRKRASEAVYVWEDGRFSRAPAFGELVQREPENQPLADDARVRLAERLGGTARRCACGREIRILEICACGRIGARSDPPYQLTAAEEADAARTFPSVVRAARLIAALKAAGHAVPAGPKQILASASLLEQDAAASALIAAWKQTGMTITVDAHTVTRAMKSAT